MIEALGILLPGILIGIPIGALMILIGFRDKIVQNGEDN